MQQYLLDQLKKTQEYHFSRNPKDVPPNWVAWVDENNHFLAWASRKATHTLYLPHRSVQIAIFNHRKELILQKRSAQKATYADHWDISASGHIEAMDYVETDPDTALESLYHRVAIKELQEEIAVSTTLTKVAEFQPLKDVHYEYFSFYIGESDGPFIAQESEVSDIQAFGKEAIKALIHQEKCTASMIYLTQYLIQQNLW
jgi:isopentenyldiphosphate isomerase